MSDTPLAGRTLANRFALTQWRGDGSVYAAFAARDSERDADVVVRTLLAEPARDPDIVATFRAAATAALSLSHPHIAAPFYVGTDASVGVPCFVAEEPAGGIDLHERIVRSAPLAHRVTIDAVIALAEALEYAASVGVTHGDLRPAHVAAAPGQPLALGGWGTGEARLLAAADNPQILLASAPYLAPEVWATGTPSPGGDLYALGIVFYEMLTGRVPFAGDNALAVARRHSGEPVPVPSEAPAIVPRAINGTVQKLLAKRPADRYASATELLADLRTIRDDLRGGRALTWSPLDGSRPVPLAPPGNNADTAVMPTGEPPLKVAAPKPAKGRALFPPPPPEPEPLPIEEPAPPPTEEMPPMPAYRKPHSFNWLLPLNMFLFTVMVATCGYVVHLTLVAFESPDDVIVPNLVGKSLTEARTLGLEKKFVVDVLEETNSDKYPEDTIYKMTPEPGRHIRQNKKVTVSVSKGPKMVVVPDVYDVSQEKARRILEKVGLRVGETQKEWDVITAKGNVTTQIPSSGESRPRNTKVDLTLSKGPEPAPVIEFEQTPLPADTNGDEPSGDTEKESNVTLNYTVPSDGADHTIRIDVSDIRGSRPLISESHKAGETVTLDVTGYGKKVTFKVYDNDVLQDTKTGPPW